MLDWLVANYCQDGQNALLTKNQQRDALILPAVAPGTNSAMNGRPGLADLVWPTQPCWWITVLASAENAFRVDSESFDWGGDNFPSAPTV